MAKAKKKIRLEDLLSGASNADLHKEDPEKRKNHLRHRVARSQLWSTKGMTYDSRLAEAADTDVKRHELAREFVCNGFNQTRAYAAVYGVSLKSAAPRASKVFNSSWMRTLVRNLLLGENGEVLEELPKEWFVIHMMNIVEQNILDFINDDGRIYTLDELKRKPLWMQQQIKKLEVVERTTPRAVKDAQGVVVKDGNGQPTYVPVTEQFVKIELHDKLKASEILAKAMQWISTNVDVNVNFLTGADMERAEKRIKDKRKDIDGEFQRLASN